jgi:hypothetical protein
MYISRYRDPFSLKENWVTPIWMRVSKYENTILLLSARSIILLENTNSDQPNKKIAVLYKMECFITAFTWGHRIIMCTCVTGWRLPPCFVRVFTLLPCYAAYVLFTDVAGQIIYLIFKGHKVKSRAQLRELSTYLPSKMGPIGYAGTSVTNEQTLPRNTPEERRPLCVISGFRREVNGVCALLWYFIAYCGKYLPL